MMVMVSNCIVFTIFYIDKNVCGFLNSTSFAKSVGISRVFRHCIYYLFHNIDYYYEFN